MMSKDKHSSCPMSTRFHLLSKTNHDNSPSTRLPILPKRQNPIAGAPSGSHRTHSNTFCANEWDFRFNVYALLSSLLYQSLHFFITERSMASEIGLKMQQCPPANIQYPYTPSSITGGAALVSSWHLRQDLHLFLCHVSEASKFVLFLPLPFTEHIQVHSLSPLLFITSTLDEIGFLCDRLWHSITLLRFGSF